MAHYEKAPEADEDLEGIVAYTAASWGVTQVRKYMAGLERKMEDLATGNAHYKRFDDLARGLKVSKYEHHYIFGLEREGKPTLILAIFHERMSMIERIMKRLT
ncbi:MAG: type II toxin-antitoxin system RelE/ParE family toxin [Gammaproteobacteria bacterium]|nr:type II toxin-antitoxin system RelE/ParE family toxin [Gammaproteobacteria bacterium]